MPQGDSVKEDDPLNMFQLRQDKIWFSEREKQAVERAAKQDARLRKQRLAEEDRDVDEQLSRESSEHRTVATKGKHKQQDSRRRGSKRARMSVSSDDEGEPVPKRSSPPSQKPSRHFVESPSRTGHRVAVKASALSARPSKLNHTLPLATQVITLDDSSDEYVKTPTKSKGKEKAILFSDDEASTAAPTRHDSEDEVVEAEPGVTPPADDDLGASYIRKAQERAKKRRLEEEAREAGDVAIAEIVIDSRLEGIPTLIVKVQVNKKITPLVIDSWRAQTKKRLRTCGSDIKDDVVDKMFFTWKGIKFADFYTLERLGITPDRRGNFYPLSDSTQEGFVGWDKVHFEAWTEELYKKHEDDRERQRLIMLGELVDEPYDQVQAGQEVEKKIRILLRSRDYAEQKYTVKNDYPISKVVSAFRNVAKISTDKQIKIHFDGEVLGEDEMVGDFELENGDILEVTVKDA